MSDRIHPKSSLACILGLAGIVGYGIIGQAQAAVDSDAPAADSTGRALSPLGREIALQNRAAARDLNLVARVEVQPGELLEFYEIGPGQILLSGAGAPEQSSAVSVSAKAASTPAEYVALWNQVSGGAPLPIALEETLERRALRMKTDMPLLLEPQQPVEAARPTMAASTPAVDSDRPDVRASAREPSVVGGWCQTNYYTTSITGYGVNYTLGYCAAHPFWTQQVCWNNVTGDGWAYNDDAGYVISNVCPYRGQVTFRVEADEDWITTGSWTVSEDHYRWMRADDLPCDTLFDDCPYVKTSVLNAAGDGYNYRYLAHDP